MFLMMTYHIGILCGVTAEQSVCPDIIPRGVEAFQSPRDVVQMRQSIVRYVFSPDFNCVLTEKLYLVQYKLLIL
jgi:hypothetical protein